MGVPVDEVADKMDEQVYDWQKGLDKLLMLQGTANEMTINAPTKLAAKVKTDGKVTALNGAFSGQGGADEIAEYDLNAGMEAKKHGRQQNLSWSVRCTAPDH